MADITRFNKLEVRGEIYRHKYVKVCIKFSLHGSFVEKFLTQDHPFNKITRYYI